MIGATKNSACRYCGGKELLRFLSLGDQPPSNSFIRPDQLPLEKSHPLDVYWCAQCFLTQLLDVVSAEGIFDDYLYLASSSKALLEHYGRLTKEAQKRFNLKSGDAVVDIGCNDGVLLKGYSADLKRIGVEPSKVAENALAAGFEVVRGFFGADAVDKIVQKHGTIKILTATNVFAHVDDIASFVKPIPKLLGDSGVFIIETPYLVDLIDGMYFDTIYHEHLCYLALTPMSAFLAKHGLEIFDVARVPFGASGPAIRVFIQKKNGRWPMEKSVQETLSEEKRWGVGRKDLYLAYAGKIEKIKASIKKLVEEVQGRGLRVGGYGAPAKGNTLLNSVGLTSKHLESIAETNKLKQGLLTPGSHIPVISEEDFLKDMPPYALLLTWNYLDFFLKNSDYVKKGGRFIVPLPEPRIAP